MIINRMKSILKSGQLKNWYHYMQKTYYLKIFAGGRLHQYKKNMKIKKKENLKTIFLLGEAVWKNLGDQAQSYCIHGWLCQNYQEYQICNLSHYEINNPYFDTLAYLKSNISEEDLIFFQSGYQTTDIFEGIDITGQSQHQMHRKIVQSFPNNKIVFMPQTVYFLSQEEARRTAEIYNRHPNLTFMARDRYSFNMAQEWFTGCQVLCVPDIVNIVIGHMAPTLVQREGILFCMREADKESNHSEQEICSLREQLERKLAITTELSDTSLNVSVAKLVKNRELYIKRMIAHFSQKKLVITNRYHGVVFAMAANTPVIVLPTKDHKVTGGIKLYPSEFDSYIYVAHTNEEVMSVASEILSTSEREPLSTVMYDEYYKNLKERIKV